MSRYCKDYTNMQCGIWNVIERDYNPTSKSHETFWLCECQRCGNVSSVRKSDLDRNPRSCNNCKGFVISQELEKRGYSVHPVNIGEKFGLLEIIKQPYTKNNKIYCPCRCECGKELDVRKDHLLGLSHSRTISCGCSQKSAGELKVKSILENHNVIFKEQFIIPELSKYMKFDFAIFDSQNNLIQLIEYNGEQHYKPIEKWGGEEQFIIQQERDMRKKEYCKNHNIPLVIIPYWEFDNISIKSLIQN